MEGKLSKYRVGQLPSPNNHICARFYYRDRRNPAPRKEIYEAPVSKWKSLRNRRLQNWGGVVHEKGLLPQELPAWLTKITERIYEESGLFPSAMNHVLINEYLPNQGIMPHQDGPAYFPIVAILSLRSPVIMGFTPHSRLKDADTSRNDMKNKCFGEEPQEIETDEHTKTHHPLSVLLMPRSLLIFQDYAYSDYLHGINDSEVQDYGQVVNELEAMMNHDLDRSTPDFEKAVEVVKCRDLKVIHRTRRVSLTCRLVLTVHRSLYRF